MRKAETVFLSGLAVAALLVGGCASERWRPWGKTPGANGRRHAEGPVVALLPMRAGARVPLYGAQAVCHLTGEHFDPGPVSEQAVNEIDERLRAKLRDAGLRLVPESSLADWVARTDPSLLYKYERSLGANAALATGADFALMGVVVRYEERSGTWWASAFPPSVAFTLVLVEPGTRQVIWSYRFDETQAPFWRRRESPEVGQRFRSQEPLATSLYPLPWWENLGWITRRELAGRGLDVAVKSLTDFLRRPSVASSPQARARVYARACTVPAQEGQEADMVACGGQ